MRDIWTRFWDGREMWVYHIEDLMLGQYPSEWVKQLDDEPNEEEIVKHLIFMRCTYLKDKHGKEIFEGDIVRYDNTCIGGGAGIAEIYWCDDFTLEANPRFAMWSLNERRGHMSTEHFLGSEIIGNIYENPELTALK